MQVNIEKISPKMAVLMLSKNSINRPLNKTLVCRYSDSMIKGEWDENGSTIVISDDGFLLDGQHRLNAIIRSGCAIETLVVRGIKKTAFNTIDCGKTRTSSDVLSIAGHKNTVRLAAALQILYAYYNSSYGLIGHPIFQTNEVLNILDIFDDLPGVIKNTPTTKLCPPRILDSCSYIFWSIDRNLSRSFINEIVTGEGISKGMPSYTFRDRMIQDATSTGKLTSKYKMAFLIKAWNFMIDDKEAKFLRWSDGEDFPVAKSPNKE